MTDRELLVRWREAWENTDKRNPFSPEIDSELQKYGVSCYDCHTRVGILKGKRRSELDYDEDELLAFFNRAMFVAENRLVDSCYESTHGSIFLLESRHGYRKGVDISLSGGEGGSGKATVVWGSEDIEVTEDKVDL